MERNKEHVQPKFDCEYQSAIICPHCGFDHTEPFEMVDVDEECHDGIKCGDCGKKFNVVVQKEITFSTTCMEGEHTFVKDDYHIEDAMICERCGEMKFTRFNKK